MTTNSSPEMNLGRTAFAVRLAAFLAFFFVLQVATQVALALLVAKAGSAHWPISLFLMVEFIGGLWLLAAAIFGVYLFLKRAALPRLNDIGLYGPLRNWAAALTLIFPISILVLVCMLFAPAKCIPPGERAA